jgi:eukaryotic-like serine/threonine-protein kinase
MAFNAGTRLGPYEILAPIGAGGMGEVYRACDTKLDRDVAIKVLPPSFAQDPERLARFEREAKVLASLNHPNIAQIYGIEERALVMEFVPGESLKGLLPLETALNFAKQIADALEAAHEKGIVHRDLKPANIMITPAGVVKVLDFGLAAVAQSTDPSNPANSPTLTISPTRAGMILGTAGYMSPEQARGKAVDKRADIWAFGVVLFEVLTGQRLFEGETVSDTLAQVLTKEPDWERVPAKVRRLLKKCLEKDPKKRLRDIGDVGLLLEEGEPAATAPSRSRLSLAAWIAAGVFALAAGVVSFVHFRETTMPERTLRYTIAAPEGSTQNFARGAAISPDGRSVVISATLNGKLELWLRPLDALQAQPIPGTEGGLFPFWSPDSRYIGFFAQGKLKKIAASGGPSQSLCDATNTSRGGTWNRDNVILFANNGKIRRVPAAGGAPVDLSIAGVFPTFLPDGRHFLNLSFGGGMPGYVSSSVKAGVYVSSLDGKENRRVLADISSAVFAPPPVGRRMGHLLFIRENTLMAQPFDAASGQLAGDAFPVAEGVSLIATMFAPVTASENGVLLFLSGGTGGVNNQIVWYDRSGKSLGLVGAPGGVWQPALSPDERMVAYARVAGSNSDVWLHDLTHDVERRFTADASQNDTPIWSPKGDRIVFRSNRSGPQQLYQKPASGTGQEELLPINDNPKFSSQWSRDGRFIVFTDNPGGGLDLWFLPVGESADRKAVKFLQTQFNEGQGQISPDGHWMAYFSDVSGRPEVYVRPFPPAEGEWRISTAGGQQPRWRGDGKELFFVGADGKMMAAPVRTASGPKPAFDFGAPAPLFDSHIAVNPSTSAFQYDVTADGKRFLVVTNTSVAAASPPLTVVVNWNAGLKK